MHWTCCSCKSLLVVPLSPAWEHFVLKNHGSMTSYPHRYMQHQRLNKIQIFRNMEIDLYLHSFLPKLLNRHYTAVLSRSFRLQPWTPLMPHDWLLWRQCIRPPAHRTSNHARSLPNSELHRYIWLSMKQTDFVACIVSELPLSGPSCTNILDRQK